jgi:dTMP kinase
VRGRFITFEGIDGAGKSTHVESVAQRLRAAGRSVVVTREPGGTAIGERLRALLLSEPMSARTETLLMFAAREEHLAGLIRPALAAGRWVLCDRFTDATYAYQHGGRELPRACIAALEQWVHPDLQPDLTLLFDVAPAVARARAGAARRPDRFEAERTEFFERVRAAYLERAKEAPERIRVIDGLGAIEQIRARIDGFLTPWLTQ